MPESFIVYIDESGDDGFKFNTGGSGSSEWFILSAVVIRARNDHMIRESLLPRLETRTTNSVCPGVGEIAYPHCQRFDP
ncbi:MAG TPA: DUF3800 domain-containing protein [Tepidisphaeraceae bacterium]|nr:DUF3800 domain-containing protein [Tepidisphaeraceae bacterium]